MSHTPPVDSKGAGMKYFSMFSGVGGFELGIGELGECIGYSEIDERAIKIYERHYPHKNFGDATTIIPDELPDFDLIVGGFPCQSFSRGGKRRGYEDSRGTLFFDICRIAKAKQPRCMLLENVAALLDHDGGRTFETVLYSLDELGYDAEWRVFDSFFYDAAPRQRVYVLAHNRKQGLASWERTLKTLPLHTSFTEGIRSATTPTEQSESVRTSARIIRTFARLPDWLDGWEAIYPPEVHDGQRSNTESSKVNNV